MHSIILDIHIYGTKFKQSFKFMGYVTFAGEEMVD